MRLFLPFASSEQASSPDSNEELLRWVDRVEVGIASIRQSTHLPIMSNFAVEYNPKGTVIMITQTTHNKLPEELDELLSAYLQEVDDTGESVLVSVKGTYRIIPCDDTEDKLDRLVREAEEEYQRGETIEYSDERLREILDEQ